MHLFSSSRREMSEDLRNALHKYLEIRGIKPSMYNFLHEYAGKKTDEEFLYWLKNFKKSVES